MDKDYYLQYYNYEREHWWFKARNSLIISVIKKYTNSSNLKILNIGAATGRTSEMLEQIGNVTSIEYDEDTCLLTKEKTGIDIRHGNILDLKFEDDLFDMVCAFDVIEHVKEDQRAISEMHRVCKTNGIIFITVPAYNSLWSEHDDINHHIKRYTRKSLKESLKHHSIKKLHFSYFNHFLFPPIAAIRVLQSFFKSKNNSKAKRSDFEKFNKNSIINKLLYQIFYFEKVFINMGLSFPFGVSLMYISKKQ